MGKGGKISILFVLHCRGAVVLTLIWKCVSARCSPMRFGVARGWLGGTRGISSVARGLHGGYRA